MTQVQCTRVETCMGRDSVKGISQQQHCGVRGSGETERRLSVGMEPHLTACLNTPRHAQCSETENRSREEYRGDKDKKWTFLGRMDYSSTRRLLILRPVSF